MARNVSKATVVAVAGDLHLCNAKILGGPMEAGLNRRARQGLKVLSDLLELCAREEVTDLLLLGDLFDGERPEAQLIAAAQAEFDAIRLASMYKPRVHLLVGNHERSTSSDGDHALGPLRPVVRTVVEHDEVIFLERSRLDVLAVSYANDRPAEVVLREALERAKWNRNARILVHHFGVRDEHTAPWLQQAPDSIGIGTLVELLQEHGVTAAFNGHWHDHRAWLTCKPFVEQLGALSPNGFRDLGFGETYGHVRLLVCQEDEVLLGSPETLPGPRFLQRRADELLTDPLFNDVTPNVYLDVTAKRAERAEMQDMLSNWRHHGAICDFRVGLDKAETQESTRQAARAAKSAETLEEATVAYVARMPLEPGVDRDAVTRTVLGYLKGS